MGIELQLQDELKNAMRAKDKKVLDVVRMLKSKGLEKKTSAGYHGGDLTEEDWLEILGAYVKQLQKSMAEFEKLGEAGKETVEGLKFEIGYASKWLPSLMSEDETRAAVDSAIAALGTKDPKQVGQVMGRVMKEHKGKVDSTLARKVAEQRLNELAGGAA